MIMKKDLMDNNKLKAILWNLCSELSSKDITLSSIKQGTIINELKGNSSGYYARVSDNSTNRKVYVRYGSSSTCKPCPSGKTTTYQGSKSINDCI